jgi:hypothetical protein
MSEGLDAVGATTGAILSQTRGPWGGGYTSSVDPIYAQNSQIVGSMLGTDTNSSRNVVIEPFTGAVGKRSGSSIVNDTMPGADIYPNNETTGLLASKWSAKSRKLFAIDSPSVSSGLPLLSVLFGNDSSKRGTIYMASTNSGATPSNALKNYTLLEEFSDGVTYSNDPTTDTGSSKYRLKVVPTFVDSGSGLYNRGATEFTRQFLTCGSRNVIQNQNWLYAPNLYGNPWRWNKRFNESSSVGSETVRMFPTGPWPPLCPPTVVTDPAGASSLHNAPWSEGDTFFVSVVFQFEDGSFSAPYIPRMPNSTVTSGRGFVVLGSPTSVGSQKHYSFIQYENIPIGPEGTTARILLRSPKQNRTAFTDVVTASPLDLRIIAVINNNTQKVYVDTGGDDNSLLEDADVVRLDLVLPRRARYIGTGDQRAIISYTLPNQSAFMISPIGNSAVSPVDWIYPAATDYSLNTHDTDDSAYTATAQYFRIIKTSSGTRYFKLYKVSSSGSATGQVYNLSTYTTLQSLVDGINNLSSLAGYGTWAAQLAPGVDGSISTSMLAPTVQEVSTCVTVNNSTTLTTSGSFDNIPIGAEITNKTDTYAGNIPAGTYVVSKESSTSLTMSAAATSSLASHVCAFYSNTGDEGYITFDSDLTTLPCRTGGFVRAFCFSFPAVAFLNPYKTSDTVRDARTPDKTSVYFTTSSPGAAATGISLAPNAWVAGNRRMPHASPHQIYQRSCMGIVDIEGAAIIAYSDGIHMLANQRGSNTGEDADTRLFTINDTRGCISYLGITAGNGWAAYATHDGIIVTDKSRREFKLSGAIYNRAKNTGDLAYEIGLSMASAAADTDDQQLSLAVLDGTLACAFRSFGFNGQSEEVLLSKICFYDYSPGIEASGAEELVSPEGRITYAWSSPCMYNVDTENCIIGAMGSVHTSTLLSFIAVDSNNGTYDGHVQQINTGTTDNGHSYEGRAIFAPFISSDFSLLQPQAVEASHMTSLGTGTQTRLIFANDQVPTFNYGLDRKLPVNSTIKSRSHKQVIPIDSTQRVSTDMFWAQWNSITDAGENRIWKLALKYREVGNPNSTIAGA